MAKKEKETPKSGGVTLEVIDGQVKARSTETLTVPMNQPAVQPARVLSRLEAEVASGKASLAMHKQRAEMFPRPKEAFERHPNDGTNTEVFRPGDHSPRKPLLDQVPGGGTGGVKAGTGFPVAALPQDRSHRVNVQDADVAARLQFDNDAKASIVKQSSNK